MARIHLEDISSELEKANWKVISEEYINLDTEMIFQCPEGHKVYSSWKKMRQKKECPICIANYEKLNSNIIVKKKQGNNRILSLDQASYKTGWAIFDDEKLIQYGVFETNSNNETQRYNEIKNWLISMIQNWKPDFVGIEGIQLQESNGKMNILTFEMLARLQGIIMETCYSNGIKFEICHTATWRNYCGVKGKAIPDNTIIPTLYGFKKAKEINNEDYLFNQNGEPTKILGIYPQNELIAYKITFKDGRTALCSKDHLWSVIVDKQSYTYNTLELINILKSKKVFIPNSKEVQYCSANTKIEPYKFGLTLATFMNKDKTLSIPKNYIVNSIENRKRFIYGILHSINTKNCKKYFKISFKNKIVLKQIQNILYSLGIISKIYFNTLHIYKGKKQYCQIKSIKITNKKMPMRCFFVDNINHTFLMNDYIVTHNTRVDKKRSMQLIVKNKYDITVTDDAADAIGIGLYLSNKILCEVEVTNWEK